MAREIVFTIGGGKVELEVNGCTGEACKEHSRSYEQALGTVTKSEDKPEMYESEAVREKARA